MYGQQRMTDKADTAAATVSYAGAGASILAGLTLTEWGVIVGIVTALATLAANLIYQFRRDRREQRLCDLQARQLGGECDGPQS